ncbi:carbon-nitrogen hydrolase family protein [Cryobacterium tagatosivorans]|uniref:Carbon-nitrogen hydrolase family protein n=1 Tax=Cryobacterium tagatosivorans TaxID=1259199 RepID=A0A4R8UL44_9MICO|nr:carbon-nitrogen hydrolase family protein [Cryobacterium tagatosivorans]
MSRPVTVSCLTAVPLTIGADVSVDEVIDREIAHWAERLEAVLPDRPDIIVLPEAADRPDSTGFRTDRQHEYYVHRGMRVRDYFSSRAAENGCYIAYSSGLIDDDGKRNATQIIDRSGAIVGEYVKNHPTVPENEEIGLEYGTGPTVFNLDFGRVGAAICFDLNFEELRAQYAQAKPELIIFSSEYHGSLMQNYWAYSLRAYVAACIRPPAPSAIISPLGETLKESTNYFPHVTQRINLDFAVAHLDGNWEKLAAARKKYGPEVGVHDPGRLGSVLITSESSDFSAADIVKEFDIELLDDFLNRCRRHRAGKLAETAA